MKVLIIGGAGFIGVNLAESFVKKGHTVTIYDNLSRKGSKKNLAWLEKMYPSVKIVKGDLLHQGKLANLTKRQDVIFHLAAQVAVTTSVQNPRKDFEINALGTFNVLEAVRLHSPRAVLFYSSTNKVYGKLEKVDVIEKKSRYVFKDTQGISEEYPLDFHSPYGCSKGAADQYVRDYARIYGLRTVVFRQSCIYGPHQFGVEDQGWLAWLIIACLSKKPITIYGNGKQVRDILYIDDLIHAYELALKNINRTSGKIYNIGGGPQNTISVWHELRPILESLLKRPIKVSFSDWRPGDQPIFVSDISKAKKDFQWEPKTNIYEGITKLHQWFQNNL